MAAFGGVILTNKGRDLLAKSQAGATLNFTRVGVGDGQLGPNQSIEDLTDLINETMSLDITKLRVLGNGKAVIGTVISNQHVTTGFYFREIGVFAEDPDEGEILYCYAYAGDTSDYIAPGGVDVIEKHIDIIAIIANTSSVTATIDTSLVFVTTQEMNDHRTAAVIDHPDGSVTTAKIADGAVTDIKIGNRTVSDTSAPTGNIGTLSTLLNWIAYMIKAITGKSNWRTAPATSLEAAKAHMDATSNVHGATPSPSPNSLIQRDSAGRAKVAAPVAYDDIARKADVDAHANRTDNPHGVTKTQVGLGNVHNYGIASQAQAEAGLADTVYMTPQRTTQAIDSRTRYGVTGGTATALTLTLSPAPAKLYTGMTVTIKLHTNTGANPTLNVNNLGAKALYDGAERFEGEAGRVYTFVYDGTNFILSSGGGDAKATYNNYVFGPKLTRLSAPSLPEPRSGFASVSFAGYAIFACGYRYTPSTTDRYSYALEAYNSSLVRSQVGSLSDARTSAAATVFNNHAIFAGGEAFSSFYSAVDVFNSSFTRSGYQLSQARRDSAATAFGSYALIAGGEPQGIAMSDVVDAYNSSFSRTTPTALSVARTLPCGVSIGNYALIAGGELQGGANYKSATVDVYDTSLTRILAADLSEARQDAVGIKVGSYALIAGGYNSATVDAYDASLTRVSVTSLRAPTVYPSGAYFWKYAVVGEGSIMDAYDASLTRTLMTQLSLQRNDMGCATTGKFILFAGGTIQGGYSSYVEAYKDYEDTVTIAIPPGSKYNFGSGEQTATADTIVTVTNPVTGYIKFKRGVFSG